LSTQVNLFVNVCKKSIDWLKHWLWGCICHGTYSAIKASKQAHLYYMYILLKSEMQGMARSASDNPFGYQLPSQIGLNNY
jgi:hypothetical protein